MVFDALQACWSGLIRGSGRQHIAAPIVRSYLLHCCLPLYSRDHCRTSSVQVLVSYWVFGVPVALLLAFKAGLGVPGELSC